MEFVPCNLCGEDNTEVLFQGKDRRYAVPGEVGIVSCRQCGLVYTNPRPDMKEISRYYPVAHYGAYQPYNKTTYRAFVYMADRFYGTSARSDNIPWLYRVLGQILAREVRGIPRLVPGGKILDVGSANGRMVHLFRDVGWDAEGVDFDEQVTQRTGGTGIKIHCGSFFDVRLPKRSYDVIRFWHVLEHLHDPRRAIQISWTLLKESGLLILGLPNFRSWQRRLFGPYWRNLDAPRHLYHFTPATISRMLSENGFEITKIRSTNLSHGFIGSVEYFVVEKLGLQPRQSRVDRWRYANWALAVPFDMFLDLFIAGDFMEVQAKKRNDSVICVEKRSTSG